MPRSRRRKIAAPASDEVQPLLVAHARHRLEAIVTVALTLVLRRAEIPSIRWEDIGPTAARSRSATV